MRLFRLFIVLLLALSISSCALSENSKNEKENENSDDRNQYIPQNSVTMTAKITDVDEKITVEVLESDYTSGTHLVITSDSTIYLGKNGNEISRSDLKENDVVEISYSGQVMLSYPPQIVALQIKIAE